MEDEEEKRMEDPTELFYRHHIYNPLPEFSVKKDETALLIVDMQHDLAHMDYGLLARAKELNIQYAFEYYYKRLEFIIRNIRRLLDFFRQHGMEVIQTKIEALTLDARDRALFHKLLGISVPKGSKGAEILEELKPLVNEIVLPKTCSGVFNGTTIDQILKNLGIKNLVVTGIVTDGCVESAVRDAADRGYLVILVEDGCATFTEESHKNSINTLKKYYAKVKSTDEVIEKIKRDNAWQIE